MIARLEGRRADRLALERKCGVFTLRATRIGGCNSNGTMNVLLQACMASVPMIPMDRRWWGYLLVRTYIIDLRGGSFAF